MKVELVKAVRYYKGMTQPKFAEWLGVANSTVSQIESGHRRVSDDFASKLARKFDVTDADFIEYKDRRFEAIKAFKDGTVVSEQINKGTGDIRLRLKEIRGRIGNASAGPWFTAEGTNVVNNIEGDSWEWTSDKVAEAETENDAEFIANSRQDISDLIDIIEAMLGGDIDDER